MEMTGGKSLTDLHEDAERGRKAQIAFDVLNEFLTERRNDIVIMLERGTYNTTSNADGLADVLAEMRVIAKFLMETRYKIQRGKYAEEELSRNGD